MADDLVLDCSVLDMSESLFDTVRAHASGNHRDPEGRVRVGSADVMLIEPSGTLLPLTRKWRRHGTAFLRSSSQLPATGDVPRNLAQTACCTRTSSSNQALGDSPS
jgi:hypothetical protein